MNYELWLCNDEGTRIADLWGHTMLDRAISFTATRIANDIGTLTMQLPATFDPHLLQRDQMIQVWRRSPRVTLQLFRIYFLRGWTYETRAGNTTLELHGRCTNDLLRRKVVRAAPGTGDAKDELPADDFMKKLVTVSQSDAADYCFPAPAYGSRDLPQFYVEGYTSQAPMLKDDFSYEVLLESSKGGALNRLASDSANAGTQLWFDIVPLTLRGDIVELIFRTRTGQPGQDITSHGVIFSRDRGNLSDCRLSYDYTKEVNLVFGVEEHGWYDTKASQIYIPADIDASIWNRCESVAPLSEDKAYLRRNRGRTNFTGTIIDTAGMRFGRDWHWGDRVKVRYLDFQFEATIIAVALTVDKRGHETISARIEYEQAEDYA